MLTQTLASPPAPPTVTRDRRGSLALALQEVFTVSIRVRANRQMAADAGAFRAHVKQLLSMADADARRAAYDAESVKLAIYAAIALLDESVLNSNLPMFASWPRQSLQEEVFGDHVAGENFYRHLQDLLGRQDSEELADLLEVFQTCLLLGFRGRYALGDQGAVDGIVSTIQQKIRRIRGEPGPLSPLGAFPADDRVPRAVDPWLRRLAIGAAAMLVLAVGSYIAYRLMLSGGIADLRLLTSQLVR